MRLNNTSKTVTTILPDRSSLRLFPTVLVALFRLCCKGVQLGGEPTAARELIRQQRWFFSKG